MTLMPCKPKNKARTALAGVRVLEISHRAAAVSGRILRDLGAEVLKVEPPGGEASRFLQPIVKLKTGEVVNSFWLAFNVGKKSIYIDLETDDGTRQFAELICESDIVLIDYERVSSAQSDQLFALAHKKNPALIWAEILPFGRGKPHEDYPGGEIVIQALGGHLYLNGDVDRPPVWIGLPVAAMHGGAEAASAALMAYFHRLRSGSGQRVDISLQECITWTLLNSTMTWQLLGINEMRGGEVRKERANKFYTRIVWPCADGHIVLSPVGGGSGAVRQKSYAALVHWMAEEGMDNPLLLSRDWNGKDANSISQEDYDKVAEFVGQFILTKTKTQLMSRAVRNGILLAPVSNVSDVYSNDHLRARLLFRNLSDSARGVSIEYPAAWVSMSCTPLRELTPAPLLGDGAAGFEANRANDAAEISRG